MAKQVKERFDIPVEPKAGALGTFLVVAFGVASILAVFVAAYLWTDADTRIAAAVAFASIIIPMTVGYFVSELRHQRSGAFWFVMTSALMIGAFSAWSYNEQDAFQDRQNLIAPGVTITPAPDPASG